MIRIQINRETCSGFGTCVMVADSIFDLDDDGLVVLKQGLVDDEHLAVVRQAAYDCPTESITLTEHVEGSP
jgi:ferredoxin